MYKKVVHLNNTLINKAALQIK